MGQVRQRYVFRGVAARLSEVRLALSIAGLIGVRRHASAGGSQPKMM